jgi:hypothetical protein
MTLGIIVCCSFCDGRVSEERKMRRAYMSVREVIATYQEDMTLYANSQPGNTGTCRRW